MHAAKAGRESWLPSHRFALLFLFLLASLILYPEAENSRFGYYALRLAGSAVIIISVYAASFRHSIFLVILVLGIPALFERMLLPEVHAWSPVLIAAFASFVFDVVIVFVIFRRIFSKEQANTETVFGALCIYLLLGFSFASVYHLLASLRPNSFFLDPAVNFHTIPNRFDFVYYSFGTITSLGASGIVPVSPQARSFTILEAILGVLYLAVLIARLMVAYRSNQSH